MKCLSVKNPLSYLICSGIKDIENRTWQTDYRGTVLIHSCGGYTQKEIWLEDYPEVMQKYLTVKKIPKTNECLNRLIEKIVNIEDKALEYYKKKKKDFYISNSIIGEVILIDIIKNSNSIWANKNSYHWVLKNAVLYNQPILNIVGKLKLFEIEI